MTDIETGNGPTYMETLVGPGREYAQAQFHLLKDLSKYSELRGPGDAMKLAKMAIIHSHSEAIGNAQREISKEDRTTIDEALQDELKKWQKERLLERLSIDVRENKGDMSPEEMRQNIERAVPLMLDQDRGLDPTGGNFYVGTEVGVTRSSGEVEWDWVYMGRDARNQGLVRKLDEEGEIIEKRLPDDEILEPDAVESENEGNK